MASTFPGSRQTFETDPSLRQMLSPAERHVIAESERDLRRSLHAPDVVRAGLRGPFWPGDMALADPRLEKLRRYAVLLRLVGPDLPPSEQIRMERAGYAPEQIYAIRDQIAKENAATTRRLFSRRAASAPTRPAVAKEEAVPANRNMIPSARLLATAFWLVIAIGLAGIGCAIATASESALLGFLGADLVFLIAMSVYTSGPGRDRS